MRVILILSLLAITTTTLLSQENTAGSLYLKENEDKQLDYIESESGDLYNKLGHHGPAIENKWIALRVFFSRKAAIDVYSKAKPGLELTERKWYPSEEEQLAGWGADYYKVGNTVGLGGIKLWDGKKVLDLHPVQKRTARVSVSTDSAWIEMISEGVPYQDKTVDIKVLVTVYSSTREAKVEAFSMTGEAVQFVTGVNYFKNLTTKKGENYALAWGIHPEDVATEQIAIGAAIVLPKDVIAEQMDDGSQFLFITKPMQSFSSRITSYSEREEGIDSFEDFEKQVEEQLLNEN